MSKLTPRQQKFVAEYLVDMNATQAAIRTGYSARSAFVQGSRLLSKDKIKTAVKVGRAKLASKLEITQERVLLEYARIAFADTGSVMTWGPHGVSAKPSHELSDDERCAVAEVSQTVSANGDLSMRVKMHDKKGALDSLARHLGLFVDRVEVMHTRKPRELDLSALEQRLELLRGKEPNPRAN